METGKVLIIAILFLSIKFIGVNADCSSDKDCEDDNPCTLNICDVITDKCNFKPIPDCITCGNKTAQVACIPIDKCYMVECTTSSNPCLNIPIECDLTKKNFTSLGVMIGVLVLYIVAMIFAVKKDREENQGPNVTVTEESQKMNSEGANKPQLDVENGKGKEDDGCCCCECCGCGGGGGGAAGSGKNKKGKGEGDDDKGCCSCIRLFLCNNPLTRADKITILLCMIFLNILLSAGLNEKGIVPSKAQQYVIGLISGSVGLPVKTVITMLFGKVPKKQYLVPYLASYAFCILCFVITMIYTIEFSQSKANKWLVSTGISTLEDIAFIGIYFFIIYFCPVVREISLRVF